MRYTKARLPDGPQYKTRGCTKIEAFSGPSKNSFAGQITVCAAGARYLDVLFIGVPGATRRGIATGLYEQAAKAACAEGRQLSSVRVDRNAKTDAFWKKQVSKGRAVSDKKRTALIDSCSVPTLAGPLKKR